MKRGLQLTKLANLLIKEKNYACIFGKRSCVKPSRTHVWVAVVAILKINIQRNLEIRRKKTKGEKTAIFSHFGSIYIKCGMQTHSSPFEMSQIIVLVLWNQ